MEIESTDIENSLEINYFKISYPNQNYKLSLDYKQWKKNIEEKLGKNGYELFCKNDNIIIYQNSDNCNCPICHKVLYKCKYCKKTRNKITKRCCLKAYINDIISDKNNLNRYIMIENNEAKCDFYYFFFINIIPCSFASQSILSGVFLFYCGLENIHGEKIDNTLEDMKSSLKVIYFIISCLYILSMLIAYSIFFYTIYFIILILSLPFKLYTMRLL